MRHDSSPTVQRSTRGSIVVNSRCVVALDAVLATGDQLWTCDGEIAAVRLARDVDASAFRGGALALAELRDDVEPTSVDGRWMRAPWDLLSSLSAQLFADIAALAPRVKAASLMHDAIGSHPLTIEHGSRIEPYVVFDVTAGPVLVRRGASIAAFTRIAGPCFIGEDVTLVGDRISNCSIGEKSKVRGELSSSIILGHSNKGHTGFVGHSYLGRWVNLGSGTTTSNLKNTYGTVQMWTPSGSVDTGQQFLGSMIGDHAKTGIGTMLNTGTVIGAGANVFGAVLHPKYIPPFAWGDGEPYGTFDLAKLIAVAARVMKRRDVELGDAGAKHLTRVYTRVTAG